MIFKPLAIASLLLFSLSFIAPAQNKPAFDVPPIDTVIVNTGTDFIIISNLNDGDTNQQEMFFEVTSSDDKVLKADSVSYTAGDKMALIWVSDQGVLGKVTITVKVSDADGTTTKDFEVIVSEYTHHGIKFEIHDAVFWQEVVPLNETPIFDSIVQSTNMTAAYNSLDWDKIPLTVSAGCGDPGLCDGHDFGTGFMEGFLVPEKSGSYSFYMNGDGDYALYLSADRSFSNAKIIAAKSDNYGSVGSSVGGRKSAPIPLDSGKVYAIYAVQWNIHQENGGIKWELPGQFSASYIDGSYLYPIYDTKRPANVANVRIEATGDHFLKVAWDKSSDDQQLSGYNIYVNGVKQNKQTDSANELLLEDLTASTIYSVAVTAIDRVKNESLISFVLNVKTLDSDTIPPTPPTTFTEDIVTGLAAKISWDGARDEQTEIYGYRIYLNGEMYNTDGLISGNSAILKVLSPNTEYKIEIEAIDAGMNISEKSKVFTFTTPSFDPLADNLGIKTGRLEFSTDAMSFNQGIGINPDFINGAVFNSAHTIVLKDMEPGAIRWGALTANPLSFSTYAGGGKNVTIGKFIKRCNELGAFTTFCCGVENSTDWRQDPETFIRFLEYVNGPDDSEGGKLRVAEGFNEPFLKNSPGLIFEFGNEVWGADAHNAQIGKDYAAYAKWCREMATKMRASAYYDSTKIYLAYSSRYPSRELSYGLNEKIIAGDTGQLDWTAPSGYLGGNLSYDPALPAANSELEYYKNVQAMADQFLAGMISSHKYEVNITGRAMEQYMYESNTTTPTYNGRLGQAILSTDYYLSAMELGSAIPTIFHLTGGEWRITEPENNYRRLPLFITAKFVNHFCKGDVLYNTYHSNQKGISQQAAAFSERPVGLHTYRNSEGYSIVMISRDYVDDHYVMIDFPENFSHHDVGEMYLIGGSDYSTKNAVIDTVSIDIQDEMMVKVPKHSMVLIHFKADNLDLQNLPLAYFPYPHIENIEIQQGNYEFSKPGETVKFTVNISPADSWDKIVKWALINNSGNFKLFPSSTYCFVVAGSRLDNEADSLILRAYSRDEKVFDEVVLYLPKNTVGVENDVNQTDSNIFPNPAHDKITLKMNADDTVRIFNMNGSKVLEKNLTTGRHEIKISHLSQGIYTIQFNGKSEILLIEN